MDSRRNTNRQDIHLLLQPRDLRVAIGGLLALATLVISSMAWQLLTNENTVSMHASAPVTAPAQFRVNINRAAWSELANLPQVGPTLAKEIVADREAAGPFTSVEDLTRVKGIGPKKLAAARRFLKKIP